MNQRLDIPKDVDPQWASLIESCWCRFISYLLLQICILYFMKLSVLLNAFTSFVHSEPQSRPTFQEILDKLKELQKKFTIQLQASRSATAATATTATATATSGENNSPKESWNTSVNYFDPFLSCKVFRLSGAAMSRVQFVGFYMLICW